MIKLPRQLILGYKIISTAAIKSPVINPIYNMLYRKRYNTDLQFDSGFGEFNTILKNHGLDYKDKTILEIGPGNQIRAGLSFLINGCKKYIFMDKFQCFFGKKWEVEFIKNLIADVERTFNKKFDKDLVTFNKNIFSVDKDRITFLTSDGESIDLPDNSVDIVYSYTVLEHVRDLEQVFKESKRVLKKQGMMLHYVALSNHKDKSRPFDLLRYSDFFWENFLCAPESYQNRYRASYYKKLLEDNKFKTVFFEGRNNKNVKFDRNIHQLNKRFASLTDEDLDILCLYILAIKT